METPEVRRRTMQAVKSEDTTPELTVRRLAHAMGYRFRLHRKTLPGKPDLVFPGAHKVIFVHGCFWHGHQCTRGTRIPKGNRDYWVGKIMKNRRRDEQNARLLSAAGWRSLVVWECDLRDEQAVKETLRSFLES